MMGAVMNVCRRDRQQTEPNQEELNKAQSREERKRAMNAARIKRYRAKMQGERKQAYLEKQRGYQKKYYRKKTSKEIEEIINKD